MRTAVNNPFTPGFGDADVWVPRTTELAVCEAMVQRAAIGARQAPRLVEQERGYGKTSLLAAVADFAPEWVPAAVVVRVTAVEGESFVSAFAASVHRAARELTGLGEDAARAVASWFSRIRQVRLAGIFEVAFDDAEAIDMPPSMAVARALEALAVEARQRDTVVVFLIDEAQSIDVESRRAVFTAVQDIDRVDDRGRTPPFVWLLAGLPGTRAAFKAHRVTFAERCRDLPLGRLDPEAVRETLLRFEHFNDEGVTVHPDAVEPFVAACDGHPHVFQLVGEGAWAASPSAPQLTADDVWAGLASSAAERQRIASARVADLPTDQLAWARAMASLPADRRTLTEICREAKADPTAKASQCGSTVDHLLNKGVIRRTPDGIAFALAAIEDVLR